MKLRKVSFNRLLSLVLAVVMLAFAMPAFAADHSATDIFVDNVSVSVMADGVFISGDAGDNNGGAVISAMITDGGEPSFDGESNIIAYESMAIEENSETQRPLSFMILAIMPDSAKTGTYTAFVGSSVAKEIQKVEFEYLGSTERNALVSVINSPDVTAQTVVNKLDELPEPLTVDSMGLDGAAYKKLSASGKLRFAELFLEEVEDFKAKNTVEGQPAPEVEFMDIIGFSPASIVMAAVDSSFDDKKGYEVAYDLLKDYSHELFNINPATDNRFAKVFNGDNLVKAIKAQHPAQFETADELKAAIGPALYLAALNETSPLAYIDFIRSYNSAFFQVDRDELSKADRNSRALKCYGEAISKELPVYTHEAFVEAWDSAREAAEKQYSKNTSGGGSSGGGSSSKGSSKSDSNGPTLIVNPGLVRDDPLDKKLLVTEYYDDLAGYEWAHVAILDLTQNGIVSGTGDKKFEPARTLKREEFMKLLVNAFGLADMKATCSFSDVTDKNAWYYMYIASAEKAGITTGRGDGTFGIGDEVTHEEMATLVYRAALKANARLTVPPANSTPYSDMNEISPYAVEAVRALTYSRVISGTNGVFGPKEGTSRAQAAVTIYSIKSLI